MHGDVAGGIGDDGAIDGAEAAARATASAALVRSQGSPCSSASDLATAFPEPAGMTPMGKRAATEAASGSPRRDMRPLKISARVPSPPTHTTAA